MPRTSVVECPGCPPLRVLTTDVLGLIKVVEARGKVGALKIVDKWGLPDPSQGVLASSFYDHKKTPIIAVARKNAMIEFRDTLSGDELSTVKAGEFDLPNSDLGEDPIVGLHLINAKMHGSSPRLCTFVMCTEKGTACLRTVSLNGESPDSALINSPKTWKVCAAGKVICSSVDGTKQYSLFGGKGIEMNVWDFDSCNKIWTAKPPPSNSLGIFSPTWFTAATFFSKDHRKIAAGTNNHQIRLYDILAQRRPVISIDFRESSIRSICEDYEGYTVYAGTGSGDLASFDMRTGKLLGCFIGKCSGSIRSIVRHPKLPIIASCGLDSYLRVWDVQTRQLLSAIFLKQQLTDLMIDSRFSDEEEPSRMAKIICKDEDYSRSNNGSSFDEDDGAKKTQKNRRDAREDGTSNDYGTTDKITDEEHGSSRDSKRRKRKSASNTKDEIRRRAMHKCK